MSLQRFLMSCAIVCLFVAPSQGAIVFFAAALSGPNEDTPNNSPGVGTGTVTFDDVARTMRVQASFSGLTGTTSAAHIHSSATGGVFSGATGVATQTPTFSGFPLGVTSGTFDQTFDMTQAASFNAAYITANGGAPAPAFTALLTQASQGRAYLNIHTSTFGGGEIRGFLTAVPDPSSSLAAAAMLLGLTLRRRRVIE